MCGRGEQPLVARRMAPAPHVAGGALRNVYILRPLHVVLPSFPAIGQLLSRGLRSSRRGGPSGSRSPASEKIWVPPSCPPRGLGGTASPPPKSRAEPQPDTPRSKSYREGNGRELEGLRASAVGH